MNVKRTIRQRLKHVPLALLLAAVFVLGFGLGSQSGVSEAQDGSNTQANDELQEAFSPLFETYNLIDQQYLRDFEQEELVNGAIDGMVKALDDPYSGYVTPDYFPFVDSDLSGSIEGIGVTVSEVEDGDGITVMNVLEGTPAERSGLKAGDVFVKVNGEDAIELSILELASRVRGPAGSTVDLTMQRGEELIELTVERARIEIPNVEHEILENDVAYISMNRFSAPARDQVDEALQEMDVNERSGLIFDLRDNSGGFLTSAVEIGGLFIEDGTLLIEEFPDREVTFKVRDGAVFRVGPGNEEMPYVSDVSYGDIQVPIVVLINERSASASELVAGAVKPKDNVTLLGETTFGKGTVQVLNELDNGGGVRLTVARWLTPAGESISEQGVTPEILVPLEDDISSGSEGDAQLQRALDYLQENEVATTTAGQ